MPTIALRALAIEPTVIFNQLHSKCSVAVFILVSWCIPLHVLSVSTDNSSLQQLDGIIVHLQRGELLNGTRSISTQSVLHQICNGYTTVCRRCVEYAIDFQPSRRTQVRISQHNGEFFVYRHVMVAPFETLFFPDSIMISQIKPIDGKANLYVILMFVFVCCFAQQFGCGRLVHVDMAEEQARAIARVVAIFSAAKIVFGATCTLCTSRDWTKIPCPFWDESQAAWRIANGRTAFSSAAMCRCATRCWAFQVCNICWLI